VLVIRNQSHFDAVVKFAKDNNLYDIDPDKPDVLSLRRSLAQLERFTRTAADGEVLVRVVLSPDFAPHSFGFAVETKTDEGWCELLSGAAIYHGAHDGGGSGGAPTFSVSLTPVKGWAIHT
jgi:hypothetical protein